MVLGCSVILRLLLAILESARASDELAQVLPSVPRIVVTLHLDHVADLGRVEGL